ncbi:hypothetical protein BD289DRAFT_439714 [Coniella lustricola]|uniref:N-acetyltransferase domain-containing protein n=1 Tax=Coniella lustricola TaxID=2025994 RepID=A0A2T3A1C2_9PEZI|nr:hypothetical protein BD289DRAFT_439714 [Coniella lustricola]
MRQPSPTVQIQTRRQSMRELTLYLRNQETFHCSSLSATMPAIIDDPSTATMYRTSGEAPYPGPASPLPANIKPRQVTLRDRQTVATIVPFSSKDQVPRSLLLYLSDQFAKEVEKGDTYPMMETMPADSFAAYWFQNFGAIMLLGSIETPESVVEGKDWTKECLGSFYIKPNYPGRSSHVSNAGFLVTDASRNRGVGRLMGEAYLDYSPKLGYTYSVFNLVYETNVASCRIWDALGFKRIGRVPGCGNLKSYPGRLVDAIIYGRDLTPVGDAGADADELLLVSEERFEKIKYYLKHGRYPNGADRAEKSRLRSAATHYKLIEGPNPDGVDDVLMLKDKEVISDPVRQYDIARRAHVGQMHAGINKTTALIAEKYHWRGIKDTVSDIIRACSECEDGAKAGSGLGKPSTPSQTPSSSSIFTNALAPPPPSSHAAVSCVSLESDATMIDATASNRSNGDECCHSSSSKSPQPVPFQTQHSEHVTAQPPMSPRNLDSKTTHHTFIADDSHAPFEPIDPRILNSPLQDHTSSPFHLHHTADYGRYGQDHPYTLRDGGGSGMDIDEDAIRQLLTASSSLDHQHSLAGDLSDRELELILMQQLQDEPPPA